MSQSENEDIPSALVDNVCVRYISPSAHISVYKVVGDEMSIFDYYSTTANGLPTDWSAMYFQFSAEHALGTLGYRWDQGYSCATLIRLNIRPVEVIVVSGDIFCRHDISGEVKASILKRQLAMETSEVLMKALGQRNICLCCQESTSEWELIVPHKMLDVLELTEEVFCQYECNGLGGTRRMRKMSESKWDSWERFNEPVEVMSLPPNEWLQT